MSEQVADKLQAAIMEGRFGLGENVSEERLAGVFGVSRTPVRDALNALQFTGLVEVRPKRGSFVFRPTAHDVVALWEFREILEREACALSMAKDPDGFLAALRAIFEEMPQALNDVQGYAKLDAQFHRCFFDYCGNPHFKAAYKLASARIGTIITMAGRSGQGHQRGSLLEHQWMLTCLEARDMREFVSIHRAHMKRTLELAHDLFAGS